MKGGNVLFNDALNIFYLRLYEIGHILAREETRCRNYATSHRIAHTTAFVTHVVEHWLEREITMDPP